MPVERNHPEILSIACTERFPAVFDVTPGWRVPNCRLIIKVPRTRENGARMRHIRKRTSPPGRRAAQLRYDATPWARWGAPRRTWQHAVTCVGEIDRPQQGQSKSPIRVVKLSARDSGFSRPWRFTVGVPGLTVSGHEQSRLRAQEYPT
jgi:hypothetical protein